MLEVIILGIASAAGLLSNTCLALGVLRAYRKGSYFSLKANEELLQQGLLAREQQERPAESCQSVETDRPCDLALLKL